MHHRAKDITGQTSGFLTAIRYEGSDGKKSIWTIRCTCGKEFRMPAVEFMRKKQKSCGCMTKQLIGEKNRKHGATDTPLYNVWHSMKERCETPTAQAWKNYGGRGIRVCEEWSKSFEAFRDDMGPTYQKGLTLDRIDVNGNYEPKNCRWITMKEQCRNRRTNRYIETPWGMTTVAEASEKSGIKQTTLLYRLDHGVTGSRLWTTPDVRNRFTTSKMRDRGISSSCSESTGRS